MKCPNCGAEYSEGKNFCGECGVGLSQPPPVQPSPSIHRKAGRSWARSSWKGAVAIVVVVIVAISLITLVYAQPWSKIVIFVDNQGYYDNLCVYIDEKLIARDSGIIIDPGQLAGGKHSLRIVALKTGTIRSQGFMITQFETRRQ